MTVLPLGREPETWSEGWEQQKLKALGSLRLEYDAATLVVGLGPVLSFPSNCPSMGPAPRCMNTHDVLSLQPSQGSWAPGWNCGSPDSMAFDGWLLAGGFHCFLIPKWTTGPTPVDWACILSGLFWSHFGKPFPLLVFPATLLMVLQFSTGGYMGPWCLNCSLYPHRTGSWIFECHVPIVTGPAPLESTRWVG